MCNDAPDLPLGFGILGVSGIHMARDILNGILITGLLIAVSIYLPVLGFFCTLIVPVPTLFYHAKRGRRAAAVIPVVCTLLTMSLTGGFSVDVFILIELFIIGFILGELFKIRLSIEKTVLYCSGAVWIAALSASVFYGSMSQNSLIEDLSKYVGKNLEYTLTLYKEMGMAEDTLEMIGRSMNRIVYVLVRILPAFITASTLLIVWMNLLVGKSLLLKKGIEFSDFGTLNRWKSPEVLVWAVVISGVMTLVPEVGIKMLGINGLLVLSIVYFFQGIAIVAFFFEKKNLPKALRVFLYSLMGFQQIILLLVIGMGFFDVWLDIRKLHKVQNA
jgi:uncharacterized protein YybS (DUF2232 family)